MIEPENILITGANGQLGRVLVQSLAAMKQPNQRDFLYHVHASDVCVSANNRNMVYLDVMDKPALENYVKTHDITQIYHMAAILSAKGEENPLRTWQINMQGLLNILELSRELSLKRIFYPSTIAVFGDGIDPVNTHDESIMLPQTVYGMSKSTGELWCKYYHARYGLDVRAVRYPGIIGWQTQPGGGTTDYAIDIFHQCLQYKKYTCFLDADRALPMMYMDDAIRATMEIMHAPIKQIQQRTAYNIASCSFTPKDIYHEIQAYFSEHKLGEIEIHYAPDFRDQIARHWPQIMNDSKARQDWGWLPAYDLKKMVADMMTHLLFIA